MEDILHCHPCHLSHSSLHMLGGNQYAVTISPTQKKTMHRSGHTQEVLILAPLSSLLAFMVFFLALQRGLDESVFGLFVFLGWGLAKYKTYPWIIPDQTIKSSKSFPGPSKGLKFEPLNHQKQTWGLKFDTQTEGPALPFLRLYGDFLRILSWYSSQFVDSHHFGSQDLC